MREITQGKAGTAVTAGSSAGRPQWSAELLTSWSKRREESWCPNSHAGRRQRLAMTAGRLHSARWPPAQECSPLTFLTLGVQIAEWLGNEWGARRAEHLIIHYEITRHRVEIEADGQQQAGQADDPQILDHHLSL